MTQQRLGVLALLAVVSACTGDRTAGEAPKAAQQRQAVVQSFPTGSLIIPMDVTSQDNGTLRAFGLMDRLLRTGVTVHRISKQGKAHQDVDFSATVTNRRTGASLGIVNYSAGPVVVSAADLTPAALALVDTYLTANVNVNVHVASAPFSADVQRTLVASPRIAVLRSGWQSVHYSFMNAAGILDPDGNTWSDSSPGTLTLTQLRGATVGGALDSALIAPNGLPAYDQFTIMHYSPTGGDPPLTELTRELRGWLELSRTNHAHLQCTSIMTFENETTYGHFLSTAGLADQGGTTEPVEVLQPADLYAQYSSALQIDPGDTKSVALSSSPLSVLHSNSSLLVALQGAVLGQRMNWLTGYVDGQTTKGKISYLGGHSYSTNLPISSNPRTNGARLFLNGLFETPALFSTMQPVLAVTKSAPAFTNAAQFTYTLSWSNSGSAAAFGGVLSDVLPAGTTFVSATGGGTFNGTTVSWAIGDLAPGASGSVTFTVTAPEGTYQNQATLAYKVGITPKTQASNVTTTVVDRTSPLTTFTSTPADPTNQTTGTFAFNANETVTFQCSLDGAAFAACTSPLTTGTLSEGSHTFQVRATDLSGNVELTPASFTWTVDVTAPVIAFTSVPPTFSNTSSASVAFTVTGAATSIECRLNSGAFAPCTSPQSLTGLVDGGYTFTVRATDAAGNVSTSSTSWTVDTVAPTLAFTQVPGSPTNQTSATFAFTVGGATVVECSRDGAAFAACTSPLTLTMLADGNHTFRVRARDAANNTTTLQHDWLVNTVAPTVTITSGPPAATTSGNATLTFTVSSTLMVTSVECRLNSGAFAACTSPVSYGSLADGSYTFTVRATDASMNVGSASYLWVVDTVAPVITFTSTPPASSNTSTANLAFTVSEPATVECRIDGGAFAACASPLALSSLAEGAHSVVVRATDAAGNQSSTTTNWVVDLTPPTLSFTSVPTSPTNQSSVTHAFSAEAGSTVQCRLNSGAFVACTSPVVTTGLTDGSYTFTVRATDAAGNVSTITDAFDVDLTPPALAFTSTPPALTNVTSASFAFTVSGATSVTCQSDGGAFSPCTSPVNLTGLSDGSHTFTVRAADAAGNVTTTSHTWTVDTVPPDVTFTTTPANPSNQATANFAFTTGDATTVACSLDGAAFTTCTSPATLSGLSNGTHSYAVRATDAAGNARTATHTWLVDTVPPNLSFTQVPGNPTNQTSATIAFTTDDAVTVECSFQGGAFAACSSPVTLNGLADGSYSFAVRGVDLAGNTATITHSWVVNTVAPTVTITSGPANPTRQTSASFSFTTSTVVSIECRVDANAFAPCTSPASFTGLTDGDHTFTVRATDSASNVGSASYPWRVDTVAPVVTITSAPAALSGSTSASVAFTVSEAATVTCALNGGTAEPCSSPWPLSGLAQGAQSLVVTATDAAGNVGTATATWSVDTIAPVVTFTTTPTNPTNVANASLAFTTSEPATLECELNNEGFSACTSPWTRMGLADGLYALTVRATDPTGNVGAATFSWTVDTVAPVVTLTSTPAANTSATTGALAFTVTGAPATVECSVDGGAFAACTSPFTVTSLTDGSHTVTVRATDAAGNAATASHTWRVDTQPPDTTITTRPAAVVNTTSARFELTSNESPVTFECSLDGVAFAACVTPADFTSLADGLHVLLVRAIDSAGNKDPTAAAATWTVDTVAPDAPRILEPLAGSTTGPFPRFGGVAEPGSTVTVKDGGTTICTATATADGTWSCTGSTAFTAGMHTVTATAADAAGNTSQPSLPRTFTVDTTAPDTFIATGPSGRVSSATASFTFESDRANPTFECSLDGAAFTACTATASFPNLTDGNHRLDVRAVVGGVRDASPATRVWTVDTAAPAAPTLTSPADGSTTSSTPVFAGTAEAGSLVRVSVGSSVACTARADSTGAFSCSAPTAFPAGTYSATATATDDAGNTSAPSAAVGFTVDASTLDTVIIAGPSGAVRSQTATFAFIATEVGSTFECKLDTSAFAACTTPLSLSNLAEGTHTFEVRARFGTAVDMTPATRTWTVDTTAPAAPVVVTPADGATVYTRTPRYSGTADPDVQVRVTVDDTVVCTVTADSTGAWSCPSPIDLASGSHRVGAVALDAAGNVSAVSMVNTFTVVIPDVMVSITSPADDTLTNVNRPVISGTASANATVTVFVDGVAVGMTTADANGAWTFTPTTALTDGSHEVTARAEFMGYQSPMSDSVTVRIDTTPPVVTLTIAQEDTSTIPTVTFTANESPVTYTCSIDDAAFTACTSPLDVTAAGDGNHTVVVRATDAAGNVGTDTKTYVVVAPVETRVDIGVRGGGCGCGSSDGSGVALWGFALLMLLAARRGRGRLRRLSAAPAVALMLSAGVARAQVAGFEVERLDLNTGASASLVNQTGDLLQQGRWRASLTGHYQHDSLVLYRVDTGERLGAIVGGRVTAHLAGAWAPLDWLEVGVQLPIVLWQGGDDLSQWNVAKPVTTALGTPWLSGRFGLLRERGGAPIDLSLQLGLGLPFGNAAAFTNVNPIAFAPRAGVGKTLLPWLRLGGELGFLIRGASTATPTPGVTQRDTASTFTWGLSATTLGAGLRGELSLRGGIGLEQAMGSAELLLGARYPLGKWFEVYAIGGPGFGTLPGNPAFRVLAGVALSPPIEPPPPPKPVCDASVSDEVLGRECAELDLDDDGVKNAADRCLRVAGVASQQGCVIPDSDSDGLNDEEDECPKEAGPRERKGCPVRDRDTDGIEDADDQCPDEKGTADRQGCPIRDRDNDTVEDANDACPDEAGLVERKGCPIRDQDGDTVEDALDNCPTEKGEPTNAGCPKKQRQLVIIQADRIVISEKIYFATGKSEVLAKSFALLDNVAKVLNAHPEVKLVRIEGHTDAQGKREMNVKLSQARAESVKAYLVKQKVDSARLHAVGFGPDKPTTTNDTPAGREQNRRVEFNFETPEAPH